MITKEQIVTDIGGVLVPDGFSKKTLMEDLRDNGRAYVQLARPEDVALIEAIGKKAQGKDIIEYVCEQLEARNKDPLFLELMGRVNLDSLEAGRVQAPLYDEVPTFLWLWNGNIHTFSNGSANFQRAMFRNPKSKYAGGDLSQYFGNFFDTTIIGKKDNPDSYKRICDAIKSDPREVLYQSDTLEELDAASTAGLAARLIKRPAISFAGIKLSVSRDEKPKYETFSELPI